MIIRRDPVSILLVRRRARRDRLECWLDEGVGRVPRGRRDGATTGAVVGGPRVRGRAMPINDTLIAATALTTTFRSSHGTAETSSKRDCSWSTLA